jgi:hypothetical protein
VTLVNPTLDTDPNPPFLGLYTEEDMGLKTLLQGVTVTDLNSATATPRSVPVWFHNPEREERRITYPNITINFTGERIAHEREHRGWVEVGYRYLQDIPLDDPTGHPVMIDYPIPMDLDYTLTASARINQHISQMSGALALGRLHPRFAQVTCPGGTVRRLQILGVTRANGMEADKRLFRQVYQVRISTEIEPSIALAVPRVRQIVTHVVNHVTSGSDGLIIRDTRSGQIVSDTSLSSTAETDPPLDPSIPGQYRSVSTGG